METAIERSGRRKKRLRNLGIFVIVVLILALGGAPGMAASGESATKVSAVENLLFEDDWFANERLTPRERLEQPEVLEALFRGEPFSRVARMAGVPVKYLKQWIRRLSLDRQIDMEVRRVAAHMRGRNLKAEKYLALSTSLCNLIAQVRLLRDEPTAILESRNNGRFERVAEAVRRRSLELSRGEGGDQAVFEYRGVEGSRGG